MPILSVITPGYQPVREHLLAAYESLRSQELPDGWYWEWVVQDDGTPGENAVTILPHDERVRAQIGRRGGVALARNLALARARGVLVKNLDQDDILTPGVLTRDIDIFETNPTVWWTTSRVLDLLPDGSLVGFPNDPPTGQLPPGFVLSHWRSHDYRLPVHPTTLCIRRQLAVALGGWMAVPGSDDTGLLVAASVVSTGYFRDEVGLHYRKWPGQVSASPDHTESSEWNLRMQLISERADALIAVAPSWTTGLSCLR